MDEEPAHLPALEESFYKLYRVAIEDGVEVAKQLVKRDSVVESRKHDNRIRHDTELHKFEEVVR